MKARLSLLALALLLAACGENPPAQVERLHGQLVDVVRSACAIIQMGVNIGDRAVISALSLVNPMFQRARGLGAVLLSSELGRIARPRFHNDSPVHFLSCFCLAPHSNRACNCCPSLPLAQLA
jgi:hypothetical protein